VSARGYRVVYDEEVRRVVASLPTAGKQSLAELFRELTRDAPLLGRLSAGPTGHEVAYASAQELLVAYASAQELLVAYRIDHGARRVEVLSLVWLGAS
jgi:hypothetical protein